MKAFTKFIREETKMLKQKFGRRIFTENGVSAFNGFNAEGRTERACGHSSKINHTQHKRVGHMIGQLS
jgi:hypothetical protein